MDDRRHDPYGRIAMPIGHVDRPGRVALLIEAADALVSGEPVPANAARFLGKALQAWLREAGDLEHRLGVRAPAGSHHTPAALARRLVVSGVESEASPTETRRFDGSSGGAQDDQLSGTMIP